jgi:hypothetical protein
MAASLETEDENQKLLSILADGEISDLFRDFLQSCHCIENFFFWIEVENYVKDWESWYACRKNAEQLQEKLIQDRKSAPHTDNYHPLQVCNFFNELLINFSVSH